MSIRLAMYTFLIAVLAAIVFVTLIWFDYTKKVDAYEGEIAVLDAVNAGQLKIGIIGDSWAAGRKTDDYLVRFFENAGKQVSVVSFGQPGAKSRDIYQNLFKNPSDLFSSNAILTSSQTDIAIVFAGVNDTLTYVGADFYAHHLRLIMQILIQCGITPLIVEIPAYGIDKIDSETILGKMRRRLMRLVHHLGEVNVIPEYRQAAIKMINDTFQENQYLYFSFDHAIKSGENAFDFYKSDFLHLNEQGNKRLADEIGKLIVGWNKPGDA